MQKCVQTLKLQVFFSETLPKYNANYFFLIFEFLISCGRAVRQAPQSSVVWEECTFLVMPLGTRREWKSGN